MSNSSKFNATQARRRNINHFNVDIDSFGCTTSLVNFADNLPLPQNSAHPVDSVDLSKKDLLAKPRQSDLTSSASSSLPDFSSFISAPAAQLWNSAQNSIQAFADQYSQVIDFQERSPEDNPVEFREIPDLFETILPIEMPFRDRTAELRIVIKSNQLKFQPNGSLKSDEREKIIRSSIQFNQLARRIGRDLCMTCAKMEKLTQLAKKKSLFQDQSKEMEDLSHVLKQDITGLNKQIANLQELAIRRSDALHREQQCKDHSKLVVVGLQSKLADVSKNFQNVLEICTENMKLKRNRREKFSQPGCVPSSLPLVPNSGNGGSFLLHDDAIASGSSSVTLDMDTLEQQRIQDQMSLIDGSQAYQQDRLNAMQNIESSISELGTIFRQLATLVSEQGEMITRIDSNVEQTSLNVEAAHHELLKYFNNISKNRWLIIKVFGVLMAFFVFFVIFMT